MNVGSVVTDAAISAETQLAVTSVHVDRPTLYFKMEKLAVIWMSVSKEYLGAVTSVIMTLGDTNVLVRKVWY